MNDIFEFNHIDNSLPESEVTTLKEFYNHYHKKWWCFMKSYKRYKILDETLTLSGVTLVITGTIIGGITLNPIILGIINGVGVIVSSVSKIKNYKKKIEMSQIAYVTYEKVLVELLSALRGDEFDKKEFIDRMKIIDEMIIDQTPIADRFVKKYNKQRVLPSVRLTAVAPPHPG